MQIIQEEQNHDEVQCFLMIPTILTMLLGILSSLLVVLVHGVLTTAMLQKQQH